MYCLNSHKGRHARPRHGQVKECTHPNHGRADAYTNETMTCPRNGRVEVYCISSTKQSNSWTSEGLGFIFIKCENQLNLSTNEADNYLFT